MRRNEKAIADVEPQGLPRNQPIVSPGSGAMFDQIANRYDLLNRMLSWGFDQSWRRRSAQSLKLGRKPKILDLATGTGDMAFQLLSVYADAEIVGLDPSAQMLGLAQQKACTLRNGTQITFLAGSAEAIPSAENRYDAVTIAFGIRNVADRRGALREIHRVLKPDGQVAILELSQPRGKIIGRLARGYIHRVVPRLGGWLSGPAAYRYLEQSIADFPPEEQFSTLMRGEGFVDIHVTRFLFGACCLYRAEKVRENVHG